MPHHGGGWRVIHEPFAGAWQRGVKELNRGELGAYPILYACLSRISQDIGKLPFHLVERDSRGLWHEVTNPAYSPVLRRPNGYQTPAQFREAWVLSRLQSGNVYVMKERDGRNVVTALHVLDPDKVTPLVSESGRVFYRLSYGTANTLVPGIGTEQVTIPASEVIHDRESALYHPLIGVAPLAASALAAGKNLRILKNETAFFENGARPTGILTAPAGMSDEDADALSQYWQNNFGGANTGRIAIVGADLKYQPFAVNGRDSQLVEQLKFSDEQIAAAFGIPAFMVGAGPLPSGLKADDVADLYHRNALQARIEAMEDCLDAGLGMGDNIGVELDLEPLLRMNPERAATVESTLVGAGVKSPNEARRRFNLPAVEGGDSPFLQQQNYSLEALARRDAGPDPFGTGTAAPPAKATKPHVRLNSETGAWEIQPAPVTKRLSMHMDGVEKFVSNGERILRGIASTPNIDRQGDIVEPLGGSWKLPVPLLWAHDHGSPVGWVREAKATPDGILVTCEVAQGVGRADEAWALAEAGLAASFSIGFRGLESEPIPTGRRWVRWELLELSIVVVPANSDARITAAEAA